MEMTDAQIRGRMMQRHQQLDAICLTIDAVIHDAQLLKRQLEAEKQEFEKAIELSLQASEARAASTPSDR